MSEAAPDTTIRSSNRKPRKILFIGILISGILVGIIISLGLFANEKTGSKINKTYSESPKLQNFVGTTTSKDSSSVDIYGTLKLINQTTSEMIIENSIPEDTKTTTKIKYDIPEDSSPELTLLNISESTIFYDTNSGLPVIYKSITSNNLDTLNLFYGRYVRVVAKLETGGQLTAEEVHRAGIEIHQ